MKKIIAALLGGTALASAPAIAQNAPHNVILFVADGLRPTSVTPTTTPTMMTLMNNGVRFTNTHSLFPTFTTANASGMATGHLLGDTGDFSNTIYSAFKVPASGGSVTPFLENDVVIGQMNAQFGGNYLNETSILAAARAAGYSTASIGKVGPVHIFDATESTGQLTINIDDATGGPNGIPLETEVATQAAALGLPTVTPARGLNGSSGNATTPGTKVANIFQQQYFATMTTNVVLPLLAGRNKPFVMVFWSRDPDGTQHNQGDSLLTLTPGINGPTSRAAVRNADNDLRQIIQAVDAVGLTGVTDIIITADHGFSTISKQSASSNGIKHAYANTPAGFLPKGFVAIDIAIGLGLPLYDPDNGYKQVDPTVSPTNNGNAVIGDPNNPTVVVAANGGSDLIYVRAGDTTTLNAVTTLLSAQDYTSGLFVDDAFGTVAGTLPMSAIGLKGTAVTPQPSIAISFKTSDTGCGNPLACGVEVADSGLQQGQGMHGTFGRADTAIIGGAIGPDFRSGLVDTAPSSNADVGITIAALMQLNIAPKGTLVGRVLTEALVTGGAIPTATPNTLTSLPDANGNTTRLNYQSLGSTLYFDAAGYPGRTVGLQ